MKTLSRIVLLLASVLYLSGCKNGIVSYDTADYLFADSTDCVYFTINLQLPSAKSGPAAQVRDTLLSAMVRQMERFGMEDEPHRLVPYSGVDSGIDSAAAYYGRQMLDFVDSMARQDRDGRLQYTTFFPSWEYNVAITKIAESDKFIVFKSSDYIYMGGAHGGVTGAGDITFSKTDGKPVRTIIDRSRCADMQDILRAGLQSYFDECGDEQGMDYLFLDDDGIPLPAWEPSLSDSGVVFVYQQYEIAPYAAGMPSFTVPYGKMMEFLTDKASCLVNE